MNNPQSTTPPSTVIKKLTPNSNTVNSLVYDRTTKTLTIAFNSGTYEYLLVPQEVAEKAFAAESIGKFVHSELKGKFETFKKIEK